MRIGAVVVTYNRLDKLKNALAAYERSSLLPVYLLVVDNDSSDGTAEYLDEWKQSGPAGMKKEVLTLPENTGGSGGFYKALERAAELPADWIWIADDDAYPEADCLEKLAAYREAHPSERIAALCASVVTGGRIDTWHRRKLGRTMGIVREFLIPESAYAEPFRLDIYSFVGTLLRRSALKAAGLPEKDFFIAYDDSEHSLRVRRTGKIICVPDARIIHDTVDADPEKITWKKYYSIRNKVYSYRRHFGLLQAEILSLHYFRKFGKKAGAGELVRDALRDARAGRLGKH